MKDAEGESKSKHWGRLLQADGRSGGFERGGTPAFLVKWRAALKACNWWPELQQHKGGASRCGTGRVQILTEEQCSPGWGKQVWNRASSDTDWGTVFTWMGQVGVEQGEFRYWLRNSVHLDGSSRCRTGWVQILGNSVHLDGASRCRTGWVQTNTEEQCSIINLKQQQQNGSAAGFQWTQCLTGTLWKQVVRSTQLWRKGQHTHGHKASPRKSKPNKIVKQNNETESQSYFTSDSKLKKRKERKFKKI